MKIGEVGEVRSIWFWVSDIVNSELQAPNNERRKKMKFIWLEEDGKKKKVLIVEDIPRWVGLLRGRVGNEVEITVAHSKKELEEVLSSDQQFFAVALDGWLGEDSTIPFIQPLLKKSGLVISTSQDVEMRKKMIRGGCHTGGNKWDFADLLQDLLFSLS